jgi:hypothetical protein
MIHQLPSIKWTVHSVERLWKRGHKQIYPEDVEKRIAQVTKHDGCISGEVKYIQIGRLYYVLVWGDVDQAWWIRTVLTTMQPKRHAKMRSNRKVMDDDCDDDMY